MSLQTAERERSVSEKQHSGNPEVFGGVTRRTEAIDSCEGGKAVTGRLGSVSPWLLEETRHVNNPLILEHLLYPGAVPSALGTDGGSHTHSNPGR